MSKIEVDAIEPQSGTTLTLGASGDTVTVASGASFASIGIDDNATSTAITIDSSNDIDIGATVTGTASTSPQLTISSTGEQLLLQGTTNGIGQSVDLIFEQKLTIDLTRNGGKISSVATGSYTAGDGSTYQSDLVFYCPIGNNAETMRIISSGNVLVGTTTASGKLFSSTSLTSQPALRGASTSASYADNIVAIDADRNTTNNTFFAISYFNNGAGAHKFRVADSGNVTNTNNSYGSISDIKLKENIIDATLKLEKLNQVRIVNFNFINDNQKQIGVIAQELENIFPSMVEESPDKDLEGNDLGTTTKQVKYSVFVPILIKAIQELSAKVDIQQTKIDALEARITALENN